MEASMDRDTDTATEPQRHPLDEERPAEQRQPEPVLVRQSRGLGTNRHLGSVLLSSLAVLGAYAALDYGFYRANISAQVLQRDGALADRTMIALGVAGFCLLVAAGAGRISGLGPLLAGLVLGVAPTVWVFLDFASFIHRLDDVPEAWDNTTFGLSFVSFAVFPAVGGLLLGAALAGRWRRAPITS
jgi:hypothetical protein